MNYTSLRDYLLSKPEAKEDYPFGPEVAVFKVMEKMFATLSVAHDQCRMNLKCTPEEAIQLRDIFEAVRPGYHMNKRHWNTLIVDGSLPAGEMQRQIDNSYGLVVKGLKKAMRNDIEEKYGVDIVYKN